MEKNKKKQLAIKQFLIYMVSDKMVHITDIMTEIRAIKGVVTISIFEPTRNLDENRHFTKLRLKFLQFSEIIDENIKELKQDILKVHGVKSVIMKIKKSDIDVQNSNQRSE